MTRSRIILLTVALAALSACGRSGDGRSAQAGGGRNLCTLSADSGVNITMAVPSGVSPDAFASAVTARITDGTHTESLSGNYVGFGNSVDFFGAFERVGRFTVTMEYQGASGQMSNLVLQSDGCHVIPAAITAVITGNTITLTRTK